MSRVVVVTGGNRGLGEAVALLAAERGEDVCITYRSDRARADKVLAALRSHGGRAIAVQADLGDEADVVRTFEQVDRELGPIGALVNNAGVSGREGRVDELDVAEIRTLLAANVYGPLLCSREAIRRMARRHGGSGGAIVNISSVAARLGAPGRKVLYATTKGAINSFTIGLAREVAEDGIRVNAVIPGLIDTESQEPGRVAELGPTVPMRRAGRPEEVARTVMWLLSDEASYLAGALVEVSGGR